ncbi:MAG: hypothetical protein AB7R90_08610 [Reyranellaceae bacterium]
MRTETFHDGYWYCYANSTAMLLDGIGERVSPRLIEALSGVGLGAFQTQDGLPFFSGRCGLPDEGISAALALLGFACEEAASDAPEPDPLDRLPALLERGPVLLGPLDMQHLVYNPTRPLFPGVDHFVLALGAQDGFIRLHDPAGFAHALIGRQDLAAAWRADAIAYKRGHYRCWTRPERRRAVTEDELHEAAMARFRDLQRQALALAARSGEKIDGALIRDWAARAAATAFAPPQIGHLTRFALPLGVKRALDYAAFFDRREPALAELKRRQAIAFGACHSHAVAGDWPAAADQLRRLADIEDAIGQRLSN